MEEMGRGVILKAFLKPLRRYRGAFTCRTSFLYTLLSAFGPSRVCLRKARSTETMMTVSRVSRKTTKKTGTEKTLTVMVECENELQRSNTQVWD